MEHEAAEKGESDRVLLDEEASPTAGRRFHPRGIGKAS